MGLWQSRKNVTFVKHGFGVFTHCISGRRMLRKQPNLKLDAQTHRTVGMRGVLFFEFT